MNRRTLLKRTTVVGGITLTPGLLTAFLSGCTPEKSLNWSPLFFTIEQAKDINAIASIIIPSGVVPGASETLSDKFIDTVVNDCFTSSEKEIVRNGFLELSQILENMGAFSFYSLNEEDKKNLITRFETELTGEKPVNNLYKTIKSLTISGYLSSKEGLTNTYNYVPVPGKFQGCLTLNPTEKAWKGARV